MSQVAAYAAQQSVEYDFVSDLLVRCFEHQGVLIDALNHHMVAMSGAHKDPPLPVLMAAVEFGSETLVKYVLSITPPYDKAREAAEAGAAGETYHGLYSTPLHVAARYVLRSIQSTKRHTQQKQHRVETSTLID